MKPKILLVDDDPLFLDTVSMALEPLGRVIPVTSCRQSFEVLAREPVDVVVSDYYLGQGNGHDVVREASKAIKPPPVILITGLADKDMAIRSANLHVFALLEKPVKTDMLMGTVERALRVCKREGVSSLDGRIRFKSASGMTVVLDPIDRKVRVGEARPVQLTETEFNIVSFLIESTGRRVTREEIVEAVWGRARLSRNVFDTHLSNLRKKVPDLGMVLKSIRGAGYLFE